MNRCPDSPGLGVEMSNPVRNTEYDVTVESEKADDKKYKFRTIPEIDVSSGDTIKFIPNEYTIWVLIPDNRFKLVEGGSDWVVSKSFTAFKVEGGYAIVRLDERLEASDRPKEKIHYSIMVLDGKDSSDKWDYVHGENPPPRMVVPPH